MLVSEPGSAEGSPHCTSRNWEKLCRVSFSTASPALKNSCVAPIRLSDCKQHPDDSVTIWLIIILVFSNVGRSAISPLTPGTYFGTITPGI